MKDGDYEGYLKAFVYTCDLPPHSENEMTVTYNAVCSWRKVKATKNLIFSYEYILSPAKEWVSFKNLNIKLILPMQAPHLIDSSISFIKSDEGIYEAFLDTLPDTELTFSFQSNVSNSTTLFSVLFILFILLES